MELQQLAALAEPARLRVYEALHDQSPLTAAELATRLSISRSLVTFHLGRLVEAGLTAALEPEPSGHRGRPAQRFVATSQEIAASYPARRYDLIATVMLRAAAEQGEGEPMEQAAARAAHEIGGRLADDVPAASSGSLGSVRKLLDGLGYRTTRKAGELVMRNCPFAKLADSNVTMVCGINRSLTQGCLSGLGLQDEFAAELRPAKGRCCVVVRPR
ncbi:MAG: helix-turn-helix domain-containing protein [Mycobacteriales bacterium]